MDSEIENYTRSKQIAFARSIQHRAKVYLDLRYWIILRDVVLGRRTAVVEQDLLKVLREGVTDQKLICPISESVFMELMKQSDPHTRVATARLIDELSDGASLIAANTRMATEIAHYFSSVCGESKLYPIEELVWTKLAYVLGYAHPTHPSWDKEKLQILQRAFVDKMWSLSLSELVEMIDEFETMEDPFDALAAKLNRENAKHAGELRSFEQTYKLEIAGAASVGSEQAVEFLNYLSAKSNRIALSQGTLDWHAGVQMCRSMLLAAFDSGVGRDRLRSMHIHASLHANIRWNKRRQFKRNDFYDFHHAVAALAYCDAFLTEHSLAALVTAKNLELHKVNNCAVTSDHDEAIKILRDLTKVT